MTRVTNRAVNSVAQMPIVSVRAKPFTSAVAVLKSTKQTIRFVTFASMIVLRAFA